MPTKKKEAWEEPKVPDISKFVSIVEPQKIVKKDTGRDYEAIIKYALGSSEFQEGKWIQVSIPDKSISTVAQGIRNRLKGTSNAEKIRICLRDKDPKTHQYTKLFLSKPTE